MKSVLLFFGFYLVFGLIDIGVLYGIDKYIHKCIDEEIKEEIPLYLIASFMWMFTLPIGIIYIILTGIEVLRNEKLKDKGEMVSIISGIFFIGLTIVVLMKLVG